MCQMAKQRFSRGLSNKISCRFNRESRSSGRSLPPPSTQASPSVPLAIGKSETSTSTGRRSRKPKKLNFLAVSGPSGSEAAGSFKKTGGSAQRAACNGEGPSYTALGLGETVGLFLRECGKRSLQLSRRNPTLHPVVMR